MAAGMASANWWRDGVIYQIYPRSFQDSNGDGVGDLHGIVRRLDYLQWLGIDAIWLTPITVSPDKDMGFLPEIDMCICILVKVRRPPPPDPGAILQRLAMPCPEPSS